MRIAGWNLLAPSEQALLADKAEELQALPLGGLFGVPLWVCQAFVLGVYDGLDNRDLLLALGRAHYGSEMPLGPGRDPTWDDPQLRARSRTQRCREWLAGLTSTSLNLPVRTRRAA